MNEPVRDREGRVLDQVRLLGVRARGRHGVHESERRQGQEFVADLVLHVDAREAAATDDLARTVSYAELAEQVAAVLGGAPVNLLETVAARLAEVALAHAVVQAVDVVVHKPQAPLTVPFGDVQVAVRRTRAEHGAVPPATAPAGPASRDADHAPVGFALALGANLGDALGTLRAAVHDLSAELEVTAVSPLARTAPVLRAGQAPQPDYLNAVVLGRTTLSPQELLTLAHRIEDRHGRRRGERWSARTLDIDLLTMDGTVLDGPDLVLPHPRAHERAFVLLPWAQVDPVAEIPGRGVVGELAERAADRSSVRWLAADWLTRDPAGTGPLPTGAVDGAPGGDG